MRSFLLFCAIFFLLSCNQNSENSVAVMETESRSTTEELFFESFHLFDYYLYRDEQVVGTYEMTPDNNLQLELILGTPGKNPPDTIGVIVLNVDRANFVVEDDILLGIWDGGEEAFVVEDDILLKAAE